MAERKTEGPALAVTQSEGPAPANEAARALGGSPWPPLDVGDVVAGYRILRLLGAGAMGVVFEAMQEEIRRRVAIKVVRAGASAGPRFLTEARAANVIRHPGIVQVHEVGLLEGGEGYIVMQYLAGRTLRQRLAEGGGKSALPLLRQVALALAAAHEQGVIHRDLKPDNVMVIADPLLAEGERVKVLDFGLAKLDLDAPEGMEQTRSGIMMGTPLYMSPEQCRSAAHVDGKTDVYALGVMLYEAMSGQVPFQGTGAAELITAKLRDMPRPLREVAPSVPPALLVLVDRMLSSEPAHRPGMAMVATELGRVVEDPKAQSGLPALPEALVTRAPRVAWLRRRRTWAAAAVVTVLPLLGLGLLRLRAQRSQAGHSAMTAKGRRAVAMLGFQSQSGAPEVAWMSTALSELLGAELAAASDRLRMIPGESVAHAKIELGLREAESHARETLSRVQRNLGADLAAAGSFLVAESGAIRVLVKLQDTSSGEVVAMVSETGKAAELFELVSRVGGELRRKLGAPALSTEESAGLAAARPTNEEAVRLYAQGVDKLRRFDAQGASDLLGKAVEKDPQFAQGHLALADAWSALGSDKDVKDETLRAFELSRSLPRREQLLIEGRHRERAGEREAAVEIYKSLFTLYPEDLSYGLLLAQAQTESGQTRQALDTIRALRQLPPPARDDPRIDLAEGRATYATDAPKAIAMMGRAADRARAQGAPLLAGLALRYEADMSVDITDFERGRRAAEEARKLFASVGDRHGMAEAAGTLGNIQAGSGQIAAAIASYEEALRLHREVGNRGGAGTDLFNIMNCLVGRGDFAEVRRKWEQDRAFVPSDNGRLPHILTGQMLLFEGKLAEAARDLEEARKTYDNVHAIHAAWPRYYQAEVLLHEGKLDDARKKHEEAFTMRDRRGHRGFAAQSRTALAVLAIEQGHLADAVLLAGKSIAPFQEIKMAGDMAWAQAVLSLALLRQGKLREAEQAIAPALAWAEKSESLPSRLVILRIGARVRAATLRPADIEESLRRLEALLAEATTAGIVTEQLEVRLALGEIEVAAGRVAVGRARLAALAKDAESRGFHLMARKARTVAGKGGAQPLSQPRSTFLTSPGSYRNGR